MNIRTVYAPTHSDGYTDTPMGIYFLQKHEAEEHGEKIHKAYASRPKEYQAAFINDKEFYILKDDTIRRVKKGKDEIEEEKQKMKALLCKNKDEHLKLFEELIQKHGSIEKAKEVLDIK